MQTVTISGDGGNGGTNSTSFQLTVNNVAPTATLSGGNPLTVDENGTTQHTYNYTISDPGDDTVTDVTTSCGSGGTKVGGSDTHTNSSGSFKCSFPDGPASPVVSASATDSDGATGAADTQTLTVNNVAPTVNASPTSQTVQYSDYICWVGFNANDVAADGMTATTTPASLPDSLQFNDVGCFVFDGIRICNWRLESTMDEPMGEYDITVTVTDEDGGSGSDDTTITVEHEDADIWLDSDNPVAVEVDAPDGDSPEFTLTAYIKETEPDEAVCGDNPGDSNNAQVEMTIAAVGPGGSQTVICTPMGVTGTGYDAVLEVSCDFDNVDVNSYHVQATVVGDYYVSGIAEDVLVVFDPSLGFTTGGGWFYWPGTCSGYPECDGEYPGDKTNFGYTMKYNKKATKVQGSLLLISHLPDGTIYRVKSNALHGLALGEVTGSDPSGWASFTGKCTYLEPDMLEPEGNHHFVVYVEDYGEEGCNQDPADRFWIAVDDKDGVEVLSLGADAQTDAVDLHCGNIIVPHKGH